MSTAIDQARIAELERRMQALSSPIETWHPENWDHVTLSWWRNGGRADVEFLSLVLRNVPALLALAQHVAAIEGERTFPIQAERGAAPHPLYIPWSVAELAYGVYAGRYGRSQSLEVLAQRGGFGPGEMDVLLPGWRERVDEIVSLRAQLADANRRINSFYAEWYL